MSPKMPRRSKVNREADLSDLEARLARTLRPVAPPADLVQRLRERITLPPPRLVAKRLASWKFFFAVVGGTLSGLALIITLARALFYLVGRRHAGQRA